LQISQERINVSKIGKVIEQVHFIPYWAKKIGELWSTNQKVIGALVDTPNSTGLFSGNYISALRGRWPLKFLHALLAPLIVFPVGLGVPGSLMLGSAPYF